MSPESYAAHRLGKEGFDGAKSDIFSLGIILFTMCFKSGLWMRSGAPDDSNIVFRRLRDKGIKFMLERHPASKSVDFSELELLVDLLGGLLATDPSKRFDTLGHVLDHPYLNEVNEEPYDDCDSVMTEIINQEIGSIVSELN